MFWAVLVIHVALGLGLIFLVLLHSGKGGGLSDMFGGGMGAASAGSTVVERNLDRITVLVAVAFTFTTVGLALLFDFS
ncbi:MAG: preprotein translocase subunit SecG [Acidimicrobiales bacterium]|nr:preprotein translocase subunit SecG [Acidimicrobiales bacterium]